MTTGGADAGSAGGAGAAGDESAGAGGVAGDVTTCPTGTYFAPAPQLAQREIFSGTNGTFSDACEDGDVVQQSCEVTFIMGPPGDPGLFPVATGEVASTAVDCDGRCVDGACPDVCPPLGTTLTYVSADAAGAVLTQGEDGWSYACEFYGASGTLDCATIQAGTSLEVVEQPSESQCVGLITVTVGADAENRCKYYKCVATRP